LTGDEASASAVEGSSWAWIGRYESLGFCLTLAQRRTGEEMLAAFGVDAASAELMTMAEADAEFGADLPVVRAGQDGEWGFAFERFGQVGSTGEALAGLSAGTRAVSVFHLANALGRLTIVENGSLVCGFEPLFPGNREGSDPRRFEPLMRGVGLDPDAGPDLARVDPVVAALELVTLAFGVRLRAELVEGPLRTGEVEPDMSWLDES
jgi:hypothetical protein